MSDMTTNTDSDNSELKLFDDAPVPTEPFQVEVVRSKKRRRTVSAQMHGDVLRVSIPSWMSKTEEATNVAEMIRRFKRKLATQEVDLAERARILAKRYSLHTPNNIEWAESLTSVWGLCTPSTKNIRLSTRLVGFPSWVLDYVIVHELAHLHVSGHGPEFWKITRRYEKTERAIGYLIAKSGDTDDIADEADTAHETELH
jgi:predicted metal-dependent hydrolase